MALDEELPLQFLYGESPFFYESEQVGLPQEDNRSRLGTYPIVSIDEIHGHSLNRGYTRRNWQWRGKSGDRRDGPAMRHHNSVPC